MLFTKQTISSQLLSVIILFIILFTINGFSQNCNANLSVEKNRNVRSADESGTSFSLELKNTSSSRLTYTISTVYLKKSCDPKKNNSKESNVELALSIVDNNFELFSNNEVTLDVGQTFYFKVKVNVPEDTPYYKWSCVEVQVKSDKCNSISDTQLLKIYVPNPSEG